MSVINWQPAAEFDEETIHHQEKQVVKKMGAAKSALHGGGSSFQNTQGEHLNEAMLPSACMCYLPESEKGSILVTPPRRTALPDTSSPPKV